MLMRMFKHVLDFDTFYFNNISKENIDNISDEENNENNEEVIIQNNLMDSITYDFKTQKICNEPESENFKTIKYQLTLFAWFYTYDNEFVHYECYSDPPFVKDYIKKSEKNTISSFEYYTPDGEFCTVYKYIYSIQNKPDLTLYKVVPYSHDWVANPSCDDYFF